MSLARVKPLPSGPFGHGALVAKDRESTIRSLWFRRRSRSPSFANRPPKGPVMFVLPVRVPRAEGSLATTRYCRPRKIEFVGKT